jgi:very-short-patch-repair endonuclease
MLFARLVRAFPGHVILAQVAISQLLVVDGAPPSGEGQGISNRLRQLVADFVVCKPDFTAVAVVELLDDRGEHGDALIEKNRRKDRLLHAAGLKVVRVPAHDIPSELGLKTLVAILPPNSTAAQLMRRASEAFIG